MGGRALLTGDSLVGTCEGGVRGDTLSVGGGEGETDVAAVLVALLALPAATGGAHSKSRLGAATSGNGGGSPSATPVLNVGSTAGVNIGEGGCAGC